MEAGGGTGSSSSISHASSNRLAQHTRRTVIRERPKCSQWESKDEQVKVRETRKERHNG